MNCIIIHGVAFTDREKIKSGALPQNKRHWISWLKEELEKRSIKTDTPLMPENWAPVYEKWKVKFEKSNVNENSILIGNSAGATFLVRWLGETKQKIKKLILVAPSKIVPDFYENCFKIFCNFELDEIIKERVKEIVIFVSDNDHEERLESAKIYFKKLGGKLIELKGRGHFIEKHMGTKEFPELLKEVLR